MAEQQIPLAAPINSRTATFDKDGYACNCLFERTGQEHHDIVKRPGLALYTDLSAHHVGESQGMFHLTAGGVTRVFAAIDDGVYRVDTGAVMGNLAGTGMGFSSSEMLQDTAVVFHNGTTMGYIDSTFNFYTIPQWSSGACTISNASPAVVTKAAHGYSVGDAVQFSTTGGLPTGLSVGITYYIIAAGFGAGVFEVSLTRGGAAINTSSAGTGTTHTVTRLGFDYTGAGPLVYGMVYLDNFLFVLSQTGRLYNCDAGGVYYNWNPLNYVIVASDQEPAQAVTRHLNYIVAFKEKTTTFYYDAGNATGSVLSSYPSAMSTVGCINGQALAQVEQSTIWIGNSPDFGKSVYMFNGISPERISTRYIDKYLTTDGCTSLYAFPLKFNGHTLYILTLNTLGVTLVFDVEEKEWYRWSSIVSGTESYFLGAFVDNPLGTTTYLMGAHNSKIYTLSTTTYQDDGVLIPFRVKTPRISFGTNEPKFIGRLTVTSDKVTANLQVRYSDDDYTTWSSYRNIDLSSDKCSIYQGGRFRRRAYDFYCPDNVPLKLTGCFATVEG